MSGLNLLGANQWQTLQMQETTRPVVQPPVRPGEADPRVLASQQPGVQTPVETGRAAHMETMQDHVDLSLRDGLSDHEKGREERRGGEEGEDAGTVAELRVRTFGSRAETVDWICACTDEALAAQEARFRFTPTVRDLLARLGRATAGKAGVYARQSRLTASNVSLLARTLSDAAHRLESGQVDDGGKCLAILLGAAEGIDGWEAFLGHAVASLIEERDLPEVEADVRRLATRLAGQAPS